MKKTQYDMLYLVVCGIHQITPEQKRLEDLDLKLLYKVSRFHFLEAFVGMTLKKAGVSLQKEWTEAVSKAVRKNILFDAERAKIFAYMEQNAIWHMPLKGIVLKEFYPAVGMRQMSDNDILFDGCYAQDLQEYMIGQGYTVESFGVGNHDVYEKPPVYNFEMHRALYGTAMHDERWIAYYKSVKKRLLKNEDSGYGYHFSDEDFYIYIVSHEYKHFQGWGTGLRSLVDIYLYLKVKEAVLDFDYIRRECEVLGIGEFEEQGRRLCKKIFAKEVWDEQELTAKTVEEQLTKQEQDFLERYLNSGVYGTAEQMAKNSLKKYREKTGKCSKFGYYCSRLFPNSPEYIEAYPFFLKHKYLLPILWIYRIISMSLDTKRRKKVLKEVHVIRKSE